MSTGKECIRNEQNYFRLRHLANALWGPHDSERLLIVALTAYFDESFNDPPNPIMTVGGFIASERRWLSFERQWKQLLIDFKVGYFRMEEFAHFNGQFAGWREREDDRRAFLVRAIDLIADTALQSFSTTVLIADWEFCNQGFALDDKHFNPYAVCGFNNIDHVFWWCQRNSISKDQVQFVFEKGNPSENNNLRIVADRQFGVEVHFERKIPENLFKQPLGALQAADFVSWHSHNVGRRFEEGTLDRFRYDFERLFAQVPHYPHHVQLSMRFISHKPESGPEPSDGKLFEIKNQTNSDHASLVKFCFLYDVPIRSGLTLMWKPPKGE